MAMSYHQMEKGLPGDQSSPPLPYPYPRPQLNRGTSCCGGIVRLVTCLVITLALLVLVLSLALRPHRMEVSVASTTLTAFNLTSSNTLKHNITSLIVLRNRNKRAGIYINSLEADAYYAGDYWLQSTQLPAFYLGYEKGTFVRAAMAGETVVVLGTSGSELFSKQRKEGAYDVELRVTGRMRYRVASITTRSYGFKYKCWIPGIRLNQPGVLFQTWCTRY